MDSSENTKQDTDAGLEKVIFQEKVDALYKALLSSVIANIIIASVMYTVLLKLVDSTLLLIWYLVILSVNIGRYILFKTYDRSENKITHVKFWDNAFYILLIMVALCWSSVSIWLLPDSQSIHHYFPILILIGISVGAVTSLSVSMRNIITYLFFLLMPLFIVEINIGTYIANSVAVLTVVLAILSVTSAKRISNTVTENITLNYESKKYTDNLLESRNEAVAANSAKSNFISMISHELRTPLNAILGFSQLLKMSDEPKLSKEQDENIDGIAHSGKHLLSLIEELLDLSKIESHKLHVSLEEVSLTYVLGESLALLNPVVAEYNIKLINKLEENNLHMVQADTKRLKQVFINLISNAIKYNRVNGVVTISSQSVSKDKIRILISDTGDGLTEEQVKGLFTPFQRYNTKREGIGLGLYITQHIMELMHGEIGVESEIGKGTNFWFELPLAN